MSRSPEDPTLSTAAPISSLLLEWYDRHRRVLPWRALPGEVADPYRVWLSEIMLQQTTVKAVTSYYTKFLGAWPSVTRLAEASVDDVMRAWAGLGYYSRARNLHACAQQVARDHAGHFPSTEQGLRALPGIGAYTAAAMAAIAFDRKATVVDGNVERVMARLNAVDVPLPRAKPLLYAHMARLTPERRAGDFAQAMMDLGSTVCTPRSPACVICPLAQDCSGRRMGDPARYPVRAPKREKPVRFGTVFYVEDAEGRVLVRTRPPKGLLGQMTELPGTEWSTTRVEPAARTLDRAAGRVVHVFTHFKLMLDVVVSDPVHAPTISAASATPCRWVARDALSNEALPTLMRNAVALAQGATTLDYQSSESAAVPWVS